MSAELTDLELEFLILKCGGVSSINTIRPGELTALHVLTLLNRLEDERERRARTNATKDAELV